MDQEIEDENCRSFHCFNGFGNSTSTISNLHLSNLFRTFPKHYVLNISLDNKKYNIPFSVYLFTIMYVTLAVGGGGGGVDSVVDVT